MLRHQRLHLRPLCSVLTFARWLPFRIGSSLVFKSLPNAFHALLLIQTCHGCHQIDQHVVDDVHDLTGDSLRFDQHVAGGQVSYNQTKSLRLNGRLESVPVSL
ncbi:hypothetical protein D3C81_1521860 [compost metagenome]